jgi:hypothetical protein
MGLSSSGSFIPKEDQHEKVEFKETTFGLLSPGSFEQIASCSNRAWDDVRKRTGSAHRCNSENSVAFFCQGVLLDLINALDIGLSVASEMAVFNVRPDMWIIKDPHGLPIGAVEVKKPSHDVEAATNLMDNQYVLGELYDSMCQLKNFYNVPLAIGILTTGNDFRVCWFGEDDNVNMSAEETICAEAEPRTPQGSPQKKASEDHKDSPPGLSPSKKTSFLHTLKQGRRTTLPREADGGDGWASGGSTGVDGSAVVEKLHRCMYVSPTVRYDDDGNEVMRLLASALLKMLRVKTVPFDTPFDKLSERHIVRFEKQVEGAKQVSKSVVWCRDIKGLRKGQWDLVAFPKNYLYAIEHLGGGLDGNVWLVCTVSGHIGVLKFSNEVLLESQRVAMQFELEMWETFYPELARSFCALENWSGRFALRMPHVCDVHPGQERLDCIPRVQTLLEEFARKGFVHRDVKWRNLGQYKDDTSGEIRVVIYDMGSVLATDQPEDHQRWIKKGVEHLQRNASSPARFSHFA